ncbi:Protein FAR-RED ELONGATED HYPOCOTYL 3, partial [Bienertia sinuspersici]
MSESPLNSIEYYGKDTHEIEDSNHCNSTPSNGNDVVLKPYVSMEFKSHKEAYIFYIYLWVLEDQNFKVVAPKLLTISLMKTWLHVKISDVGKWYVNDFKEDHNHDLLPILSSFFPCHRNLSLVDKRNVDTLYSIGVPISKIFAAIGKRYGGGFVSWDCSIQIIKCLCHGFEYKGFVCRHCLALLYNLGVLNIPSKYKLKWWCKSKTFNQRRASLDHVQSKEERYKNICLLIAKINDEASFCDETYDHAYPKLVGVFEKCVSINKSHVEARRYHQKENNCVLDLTTYTTNGAPSK